MCVLRQQPVQRGTVMWSCQASWGALPSMLAAHRHMADSQSFWGHGCASQIALTMTRDALRSASVDGARNISYMHCRCACAHKKKQSACDTMFKTIVLRPQRKSRLAT